LGIGHGTQIVLQRYLLVLQPLCHLVERQPQFFDLLQPADTLRRGAEVALADALGKGDERPHRPHDKAEAKVQRQK
jgi:hypothetical protein